MLEKELFAYRSLIKACLLGDIARVKELVEIENVEVYDHPGFIIAFQSNFLEIALYLYEKLVNYEFVKSLTRTNLANFYNDEQVTLLLKTFRVNANLFPRNIIHKYFERKDINMINLFKNNFLEEETLEKLCIKYNIVLY